MQFIKRKSNKHIPNLPLQRFFLMRLLKKKGKIVFLEQKNRDIVPLD